MKRILVTGASGYIGSVVCKMAKLFGHHVTAVDIKPIQHKYYDKFIQHSFENIHIDFEYDSIFHLAASANVPDSIANPSLYYMNNTARTIKLLDRLASIAWKGNFIFSSTAAVYGNPQHQISSFPFTEGITYGAINPYGTSKMMCENVISDMAKYRGLKASTFRYFNVVGADVDVGDHLDSSHILQRLCDCAMEHKDFNVYGHNHDTIDGSCVRDYVDVRDIARAHFFVDRLLDNEPKYNVYNLGSKMGTTVLQFVDKFESVTGERINIKLMEERPGDPGYLVADPSFLMYKGFKYVYNVDDMISSSWDYYKRKTNVI